MSGAISKATIPCYVETKPVKLRLKNSTAVKLADAKRLSMKRVRAKTVPATVSAPVAKENNPSQVIEHFPVRKVLFFATILLMAKFKLFKDLLRK